MSTVLSNLGPTIRTGRSPASKTSAPTSAPVASKPGKSLERAKLSKDAQVAGESRVNFAAWQPPAKKSTATATGPAGGPSLTLKRSTSPQTSRTPRKLEAVTRPLDLRSRVTDLRSTTTSLKSSEERMVDLGNQIDV